MGLYLYKREIMIITLANKWKYREPEEWQNYITIRIPNEDLVHWFDLYELAGRLRVDLSNRFPNNNFYLKFNIIDEHSLQPYLKIQTYVEENDCESRYFIFKNYVGEYEIEIHDNLTDLDMKNFLLN